MHLQEALPEHLVINFDAISCTVLAFIMDACDAACRQASQELLQQHLGFFANMFTAAMGNAFGAMDQAVHGDGSDLKVGKRRRKTKWHARDQPAGQSIDAPGEDYYLVPPDRALVPIAVYQAGFNEP